MNKMSYSAFSDFSFTEELEMEPLIASEFGDGMVGVTEDSFATEMDLIDFDEVAFGAGTEIELGVLEPMDVVSGLASGSGNALGTIANVSWEEMEPLLNSALEITESVFVPLLTTGEIILDIVGGLLSLGLTLGFTFL